MRLSLLTSPFLAIGKHGFDCIWLEPVVTASIDLAMLVSLHTHLVHVANVGLPEVSEVLCVALPATLIYF